MKIKRFVDAAYEFINGEIPSELKHELTVEKFDAVDETLIFNIKNDICLEVNKMWVLDNNGAPYICEYEISYGNVVDSEYFPTDSVILDNYNICKDEVAKEINYLIGCAFPNTKIER